ncbi:MAG TPA: DUF72 domain-containing protein [Thermoleophilaceae bacterium]|nr:DUF72 domain-containing protein [Thermoleophilaceae bacterium]
MSGRILVGTSSWADPGFVKEWYPAGMPAQDRLPWYAERFQCVELNSSFYAVPERSTVKRWCEVTPEGFVFDVKLHRLLSRHAAGLDSLPPDLRESARTTARGRVELSPELEHALVGQILHAIEPLESAGKLGALLLQLTPAFSPKRHLLDELEPLVEAVAPRRLAVELRNRRWVEHERAGETLAWFSERGIAFVCVDAPVGDEIPLMPPLDAVTRDDLAYMRIHGRNLAGYMHGNSVAERFGWIYGEEELREIEGRVRGLAEEAAEVHVLFNNNRDDDAPTAARRFRALLGQDPGPPPEDPQLSLS